MIEVVKAESPECERKDTGVQERVRYALDLLCSPKKVFYSFRDRPSWWLWFCAAGMIPTIASYVVTWKIGFERITSDAISTTGTLDPSSFVQHALDHEVQILVLQGISSLVGCCSGVFFLAVLLWLTMLVLDSRATFKETLAVIAYSVCAVSVIRNGLTCMFALLNPDNFHITSPLATTAAFYLNSDDPMIERVYQVVDALGILWVLLTSRGLQIVSRKLSFSTVIGVVCSVWVVYSLIKIWSPWA